MWTSTRDVEPLSRVVELGTRRVSPDGVHRYPAVISTTTPVVRRTPSGRAFDEVLSHAPGAIDLSRAPLPLLEGHDASRVNVGIVEDLHLDGDKLRGNVVLGTSARAVELARDIDAKIVSGLSVGYMIEAAQWSDDGATQTATRWVPYETSFTGVPADIGRSAVHPLTEEQHMTTPVVPPSTPDPVQIERERTSGIVAACRIAGIDSARYITEGTALDQVRAAVLDVMVARQPNITSHPAIEVGETGDDRFERAVTSALVERSAPAADAVRAAHKAQAEGFEGKYERGTDFRGMPTYEIARVCLERMGVRNTRGMSRQALISKALTTRSGMQSSGDFPALLENALHKSLLSSYRTAPDTWSKFCGVSELEDFREAGRFRTGAFTPPPVVKEGASYTHQAIPDGEKYAVSTETRGSLVAITRQALINDDLGAQIDMAARFGRAAALGIEVEVFAMLAQNSGLGPTMGDGQPFFFSGRNNVNGTGSALSIAGLDADRQVLAAQRDFANQEFLDLRAHTIVLPMALGASARIVNSAVFLTDSGDARVEVPNPVMGLFPGGVIDTPRLTGTRRYLFVDPAVAPAFVVCFLAGTGRGPTVETEQGWNVDGAELKLRIDVKVNPGDVRGAVTNAGQ